MGMKGISSINEFEKEYFPKSTAIKKEASNPLGMGAKLAKKSVDKIMKNFSI